jgi:hypothetical protein
MFSELDEQTARDNITATLRDLSITIADFCRLQRRSVIEKWTLERVVKGDRHLSKDEAESLQQLCSELHDLANAFPVPVNWSETGTIQVILARRREQAHQLTAPNSKTPLPIIESRPVSHKEIDAAVRQIHS